MKTDDLIAILADDLKPARRGMVARWLLLGLVTGAVLSTALMMATIGPRPDLHAAMQLKAFWVKFLYTLALAGLGFAIAARQARAGRDSRNLTMALAAPVAALMVLAAIQLSAPYADTAALVMGSTWTVCPWLILMLSLPLTLCLLLAMRRLAPTRLAWAGAAAGLLAGSIAATIYGFHCPEMAAPFLLIWYTMGIAFSAGFGALLGSRLLAW
jgi:hypothetical protein